MKNLTDRARQGNWEALETLYDMTKQKVMALCSLLLQDEQLCKSALPKVYRSLWDQILEAKLTTEEAFEEAAIRKTATLCQTLVVRKNAKAFRIPSNRNFIQGVGDVPPSRSGELWEQVTRSLPPLQRFLFVLEAVGEFSHAQLAKMFHTSEENVKAAFDSEAVLVKRIVVAISGNELEPALTVEELHKAWLRYQVRVEVPQSVEASVSSTITALCRPLREKRIGKQRRVAMICVALALILGLGTWCVNSILSQRQQEDAVTASSEQEELSSSEVDSGTASYDETGGEDSAVLDSTVDSSTSESVSAVG